MQSRRLASNLGIYVYAVAGIYLGLVGLVSGDFAVPWQYVGLNGAVREALAYLVAIFELGGGIALLVPRTARIGAVTLTIVYSFFTLWWVPKAVVDIFKPAYDSTGNVFEEFSMVVGGLMLCAILLPAGSWFSRNQRLFVQFLGFCSLSFGIVHIVDTMPGIASWIPKWLPPSPLFWAYVTTICFFLAAASILTGIMAPLAARLLMAEIVGFQLLVWIPKLVAGPTQHFNWGGNGINLAIAGACWVVADQLSQAGMRKAAPEPVPYKVGSAA
ncbi:MAG TPA: hypothetical protein VMD29_13030 [Terracidiphilus sp.]|nr:hypothetical protein [Terracidiphilus sp.]